MKKKSLILMDHTIILTAGQIHNMNHGGSVMIRGAFSSHVKYDLAIVPTQMDSDLCIHIISNHLKPHLNI
uniref:Uncharacterized protein n=1 Tax=Anopheles quadriannulatus TaxID=34691 RepID=A0A182XMJ9_ANOQN